DPKTQEYHVIVEDKNDSTRKLFKDPKFMKPGDEWSGIKVESVTQDKAVFQRGGASKDVRIGEPLPDSEAPLSAADEDDLDEPDPNAAAPSPTPAVEAPSSTSSKKSMKYRSSETKPSTSTPPETQTKTLDEMRKRLKKNRPTDPEE